MNKKVVFVVVAIILLISSAMTYVLLMHSKHVVIGEITKSNQQESPKTVPNPTATTKPGIYVDYSEKAVLAGSGTKLLFFHASWCPQCRAIEASIKADGVPSGVTILKVDYDSNQKLRQQYGVTIQTTFVKIDDSGDKVASYVAYEEPQFSAVERELLP